jgi:VIT1/CCC1 family predicted Fe2+/Mn2+ transporter
MMATSDRSFSVVLQDVVRNLQEIIRAEVRLVKIELREDAVQAKAGGILVGAGAIGGLFAMFFLLFGAFYALTRFMPDWAAALTVAAPLAIAAAVMITAGVAYLKKVHPPNKTIESLKENVEWAKQPTK